MHNRYDQAYRHKYYMLKRAEMGIKREYKSREIVDYIPIAKERVKQDPLRTWINGPELWGPWVYKQLRNTK